MCVLYMLYIRFKKRNSRYLSFGIHSFGLNINYLNKLNIAHSVKNAGCRGRPGFSPDRVQDTAQGPQLSASGPFPVALTLSTWDVQPCADIAPFLSDPGCLLMPSHHCISSVLHSMGVREKMAYTSTLLLPQEEASQRKDRVVPSWLCLDWCFASD